MKQEVTHCQRSSLYVLSVTLYLIRTAYSIQHTAYSIQEPILFTTYVRCREDCTREIDPARRMQSSKES